MEPGDESALVRRVASGDRAAFRQLVDAFQRPLSAYCRRMLQDSHAADDVVQETFLRLWTRASRYDPAAARLGTWLHRIAHNLSIDLIRTRTRDLAGSAMQAEADCEGPERLEAAQQRAAAVRRAIASLPERQRSALLLCHYQGLSNRDAAAILEVSVDALESLLARARRQLRRELEVEHGT